MKTLIGLFENLMAKDGRFRLLSVFFSLMNILNLFVCCFFL